jgi:hypothetical protein
LDFSSPLETRRFNDTFAMEPQNTGSDPFAGFCLALEVPDALCPAAKQKQAKYERPAA